MHLTPSPSCDPTSSPALKPFRALTGPFLLATALALAAFSPRLRAADLALSVTPQFHIVIPKKALGREYLMSASLIPQAAAATSTGLAGKIVRFELFHDGVDLYESTKGLVVTDDLPARRLLTTLPIVEQDEDKVVVDFNKGMRRVFTEIWYGSDRGFNASSLDRTLEVPQGRVFAAEARDAHLVIRQSVQTRDREGDANVEQRLEVRYFFSEYSPAANPGKEQPASETRYARFFETSPQLETSSGRESAKMARFDLSKPVVFHYSANTPKDFVDAVRDGIVYWNRAFGKEVVKAEKAPDGVTAPDSRYNLVQWVPWDNAGFAYADILVDPRTGDSRHGQAYMTSVFGLSGKARARAALRAMREMSEKKGETKQRTDIRVWALARLQTASACQFDPTEFAAQYAQGLEELLASDSLTDAAVLRAAQDYVREVVAHEVGHVLGLRHNFAGSLAANMSQRELDDWFKDYLLGKNINAYTNRITTTSMMEYSAFKAAVFVGWKMRNSADPLPHDKAAIQWGYFDSKEPVEKKLFFGTDQDAGRYGDVQRFDYGDEPIVAAYGELASSLKTLPNSLIEQFIAARAPRDARDRVPLEQVNLNVKANAAMAASRFAQILTWFSSKARSLRVENQFDFIGDLNREPRMGAHWKSLTNQLDRLGGVDRVLFSYVPLDLKLELTDQGTNALTVDRISATNLLAHLNRLLATSTYTNFVGLDDKRTQFSSEEIALIRKRGETFFQEFETEVLKSIFQKLESAARDLSQEAGGSLGEGDPVAKLEQRIQEAARLIILAKDETKHPPSFEWLPCGRDQSLRPNDGRRTAAVCTLAAGGGKTE
ncbi:MAG: zinc-dependent metalloprotease, partial [Verrucomicrobia bacterium]|nr:zinc-dependent metalloprotease [Verrucomicrobiota bacterium]